ncbi:H-NS histone family protein [Noviherbaspirillum agri]
MKLSTLSLAELRALLGEVEDEIKIREKDEIAKARAQILAIAQEVGIPLEELIGGRGVIKADQAKKVAIQYRHPTDRALQWTGRGRQPQWIKDWLASGQTLKDLKI